MTPAEHVHKPPSAVSLALERWLGLILMVMSGLLGEAVGMTQLLAASICLYGFWAAAPNRWWAGACAAVFYWILGSEVPIFFERFGVVHPYLVGLIAQLGLAIPFGLLFAAFWHPDFLKSNRSGTVAWRTFVLYLVALFVPPFSWINVGHPAAGAGNMFPAAGHAGIVLMGFACVMCALFCASYSRTAGLLSVGLVAMSLFYGLTKPDVSPPPNWRSFQTAVPSQKVDCTDTTFDVAGRLDSMVRNAISEGTKVIILPESVAGTWTPCTQAAWRNTLRAALEAKVVVAVGAAVPTCLSQQTECADHLRRPQFENALLFLGQPIQHVSAPLPVPLLSWRPWSGADHFPASPWRLAIREVAGVQTGVLFCYEELLPANVIRMMVASRPPTMLLGVANHWWASPDMTRPRLQEATTKSMARLYSVPYLRAVNTE